MHTGLWMGCLDLRGLGSELAQVYSAGTKRAALEMARERGYATGDVVKAATRFNRFWVIAQWVEVGTVCRCASAEPGTTVVITLKKPSRCVC